MKQRVNLKQELKQYYLAPAPSKKAEFLRALQPVAPRISMLKFMWYQSGYIKRSVWLLSASILILLMILCRYLGDLSVFIISLTIPFLALTILEETSRSKTCQMEELELATRFSLPSIWLARMGALAIYHSAILLCFLLYLGHFQTLMLSTICYILTPYFLTICLGIFSLRQPRTKNVTSLCLAIPPLVSAFVFLLWLWVPTLFTASLSGWWILFCSILCLLTIKEGYLYYKQAKVFA